MLGLRHAAVEGGQTLLCRTVGKKLLSQNQQMLNSSGEPSEYSRRLAGSVKLCALPQVKRPEKRQEGMEWAVPRLIYDRKHVIGAA